MGKHLYWNYSVLLVSKLRHETKDHLIHIVLVLVVTVSPDGELFGLSCSRIVSVCHEETRQANSVYRSDLIERGVLGAWQ